ncbi:hypothetical protein HK099_005351 [Clydaea vesicula]|uniref:Uncharacterized protein n=1 Tax=Clydaea vesicula TaxID=447962 RepID=A0AAD5U3Y7_9FUNG|nr:hypothetical protein HK099_005351 [Clydaea vesicula]
MTVGKIMNKNVAGSNSVGKKSGVGSGSGGSGGDGGGSSGSINLLVPTREETNYDLETLSFTFDEECIKLIVTGTGGSGSGGSSSKSGTKDVRIDIKTIQNTLPNNLLFKFWKITVLLPKETKFSNVLTLQVLDTFRNEVKITLKFIILCFRHNLEKVLFHILFNQKIYKIDVQDLNETYLKLACEFNNIGLVLHPVLIIHFNLNIFYHAINYSTRDYLFALWNSRSKFPDFEKNMRILDNMLLTKTITQTEFFSKLVN